MDKKTNLLYQGKPLIQLEDQHIIVCAKPHGLAVQSKRVGTPDLEHMLLNHIAGQGSRHSAGNGRPYLAIIHRLDQPVAGLLVFAKTPAAAKKLNQQLASGSFGKHYLALTDGIPDQPEGVLTDHLVKDGRTNTSRVCSKDTPGAKETRLSYRMLDSSAAVLSEQLFGTTPHKDQALLEVTLDTGRHHQIRVQLAHMGCPITGDTKYNPGCRQTSDNISGSRDWQTLKLCAYRLRFRHPATGKQMDLTLLPG